MKMKGFKDIERQLKNIEKRVKEEIDGKVSLEELLSEDFLKQYTEFSDLEDLFDSLPVKIESQEDLKNIDESKVDPVIKERTEFNSWSDLIQTAAYNYAKKKLDNLF
ncbi:MAG TPA: hypothetical protein VK048_01395 [Atopostipes sp.]|nr:hypothetical protein [Atopostipes sp.]